MSEMAKYLRKRRISLHDIIFKNRKGSRDESKKDIADERLVGKVVTEREAGGKAMLDRKRTSSESGGRFLPVSRNSAAGDQAVVERPNQGCADEKHDVTPHDSGRMASRRIDSGSGENSSSSDRSELRSPGKSDSDTSEENYIMSRYFKSLTLAEDENPPPNNSRLGLPTIDTGSSRSLSAIPWSEMKKDTPLSRSCYEICSNRTPGTSCGSSCSMSFVRPKQGKSQVSYWLNTGSESDIIDIIPLSSSVMTDATAKRQSRREMLSPLNLGQLESYIRNDEGKMKKEPSSLHVSPNRSPNMSGNPTLSPSSMMSGETLPPAFSPFTAYPVVNDHRSLRPSSAVMRPFHDNNLLPLRPSSSNPTINHAADPLHPVQSRFLRPVKSNPLTRSNPNLYVSSPADVDSSPRSLSPLSSCGFSPSTSPRSQLSPGPIPIPPSSPRPSSRCRRAPRVKKADTEYQHNFDNF